MVLVPALVRSRMPAWAVDAAKRAAALTSSAVVLAMSGPFLWCGAGPPRRPRVHWKGAMGWAEGQWPGTTAGSWAGGGNGLAGGATCEGGAQGPVMRAEPSLAPDYALRL